MKSRASIALHLNDAQRQRLVALQQAFARACNALAPKVRETRCWNRVALHHMAYKQLREQFPELGSQMVCNAIYSVSRSARLVYQHRASPFNVQRLGEGALPLLQFADSSPVYFDRHTLSLKEGVLSLFTLDGRMRFDVRMASDVEALLHEGRLREVVLARRGEGFELSFAFSQGEDEPEAEALEADANGPQWPEYLLVTPDDPSAPRPATARMGEAPRAAPHD